MNPPDVAKRIVVTVIVVSGVGPLVGGLIVAAIPLVPYVVGLIAAAHRSHDPMLISTWHVMTTLARVFGFIVYESYWFGGLSAVMSGIVLAGLIGRYGKASSLTTIAIAIASIPASVVVLWMVSPGSADMLMATMMNTSIVQLAPAILAAIVCRQFLVRWRIIEAPSDQPSPSHDNPTTSNSAR